MTDIRLITLIPPTNAVSQPAAVQAVTTQGAPLVPQLPAGSVLTGFIVNRDASGNPILRTPQGDFVFSSPNFFLKIGSEVVIRIQQQAGQQAAHLVTVNGLPPEAGTQQSAFSDGPEITVGQQQPAVQQQATEPTQTTTVTTLATTSAPKPGQTISAIVVTPNFTPAAPPAVTPGTSLLLSVLPPATPQQAAAPSPLNQLTPAASAPLTENTSASPSALSSLLPPAPAATQTATVQMPSETPPPALPANPAGQTIPFTASNEQAATAQLTGPLGQTMTATVVAQNPDHSIMLDTALGTLRVAEAGNPPVGQQLTLRVASVATPNAYTVSVANGAPPAPLAPLTELSRKWTSLQQIAQVLGEEQAAQFIPAFPATPTITPELPGRITQSASQVLFFIAALKGGNFREWLGNDNVKTLEDKGYGALVKRAEGEFMQMSRQVNEPQPGNWQSTFFPVMVGQDVQQVRAFVKREKKKNAQDQQAGAEDTRFVVEMEMSQLGEMQMDGLVKRRAENLQFDLIIRSHAPLPQALTQDIQAIYNSTADVTGYRGQLSFQAVQQFPLHPLEDTTPHVFDDFVV